MSRGQAVTTRMMVRGRHAAALCTLLAMDVSGGQSPGGPDEMSEGEAAAPYASWVTVATDHAGAPVLLLSSLAAHTRALMADPRAALLLVNDPTAGAVNPQEDDRVTLMGRLDSDPDPHLRVRFLARHPYARRYAGFSDFRVWRMTVARAHRVSGFGAAAWCDDPAVMMVDPALAETLSTEEPALLARLAEGHPDLAGRIAWRCLGLAGKGWRLVAVDADGVDLDPGSDEETAGARARVTRVGFPRPVTDPAAVLPAALALADGVAA